MRKEADFTKAYPTYIEEPQNNENDMALKQHREIILNLIMREGDAIRSQYKHVRDQLKYDLLEQTIYPMAVSAAEVQYGKVLLEISDESESGKLVYTGSEIEKSFLDSDMDALGKLLLEHADSYSLSIVDGMIQIVFHFDLYQDVKVDDHTEQIRQIRKLRRLENLRYFAEMGNM